MFFRTFFGALIGLVLGGLLFDLTGLGSAVLKGAEVVFDGATRFQGKFYAIGAFVGAVCGLLRWACRPKSCCRGGSKDEPRPPAPAIK